MAHPTHLLPIVVLISGGGSNLQAIIDAAQQGTLPVEIRAVISNRPAAHGLQRASQAGITTEVVDHTQFASREDFDRALQARIDHYQPALVVLAGFMRLLTRDFVNHYLGRMLNIHPSLLPHYKGLNTHQRALTDYQQGTTREHGASVHFVTSELDGGPVILQADVPIQPGDNAASLAARVLEQEHRMYPLVIDWFAAGRLQLRHNQVYFNNAPLPAPLKLRDLEHHQA